MSLFNVLEQGSFPEKDVLTRNQRDLRKQPVRELLQARDGK